jgi:hypothetical protein
MIRPESQPIGPQDDSTHQTTSLQL